jgi:RimJ/RimL family protein N-acetyltransferase
MGAGPSRVLVEVARFYLRPLRRSLARTAGGVRRRTWRVQLGPIDVLGHHVMLRSPRLRDAAQWCDVRIREQKRIEPWWASSPLSWRERHTEAKWVTHLLQARREARAGRALPLVVEIDGVLAGQCNLEWIAEHTGSAEMGIWMDSRWASKGVSPVGAAMMVDYAMNELRLRRLIAPISAGNVVAAQGARKLGMRFEGTMSGFLDVGGVCRDHDLWAFTADCMPDGGLTAAMYRSAMELEARPAAAPPA